ncbi:hypothetical protein M758_6G021700 [Ceratodon purpureus]|nr:hypothetical protein M758_6G021700 [Ceratodon purpureus]
MDDYVEQTLEAITRIESQFKPRDSWTTSSNIAEGNNQGLVLLSQLDETKRVLHGFKPALEGHKPVRRELHRAVIQTEALAKEWWSPGMHNYEPVLAKWREHFLEILLDVRWWTMVAALQEGERFAGFEIYGNVLFMKAKELKGVSLVNPQSSLISSYERHFPSYGFEIWLRKSEGNGFDDVFEWNAESGNILGENRYRAKMALEAIKNASFPGFIIEGIPASFADQAPSPLIKEELTLDLARDILGVSQTGSWVIRTNIQGVDCALKRIDNGDGEQPLIARLSHPHVVQLMHYWRKGKYLFLAMELMEGDLTDLLTRHKRANESLLSLPMAVDIMLQTAKGMLYLHDLGFTYPHLNCSNVLFRNSDTMLPNGHTELTIKLSGGGYSVEDDSSERKSHDVHRFGSFCLEVLTGKRQCEDSFDTDADTRLSILDAIPQILRFCISSCLEGNLTFRFEKVVTLLLLAQCQILKSQKDEAFGSKVCETVQLNSPDCARPSSADADLEKYPVYQLYPELDVSVSDSNLSTTLIFFHGLAKSPDEWKSTWTTRNREHVWPKAWLPNDLPGNIRVLSPSYDTDASGGSEDVNTAEIGKKVLTHLLLSSKWNLSDPKVKVILIGHSFGGLIIKSLVVEAHSQATLQPRLHEKCVKFLENLEGIVFYSVPGSASDQNQQFEEYINKLNQTGVLQRSTLMQALLKLDKGVFNQEMRLLGSQFEKSIPEKTKILCFIEGKGMRRLHEKQVVVSYASAVAQLEKAVFHVLKDDNHFEVCRPVSKDHEGYRILVEEFLKGILETGSLNSGTGETKYQQSEDTGYELSPATGTSYGELLTKVSTKPSEDSKELRFKFQTPSLSLPSQDSMKQKDDEPGRVIHEVDTHTSSDALEMIAVRSTMTVQSIETLDSHIVPLKEDLGAVQKRLDTVDMPHVITDLRTRVKWVNASYRRLVREPMPKPLWLATKALGSSADEESLASLRRLGYVTLVFGDEELPDGIAGFTCRVEIRWSVDDGEPSVMSVPSDVVKLDDVTISGYSYVWGLDIDHGFCSGAGPPISHPSGSPVSSMASSIFSSSLGSPATTWRKSQRTSTDQSSPGSPGRRTNNAFSGNVAQSASLSPSPRRNALRNLICGMPRGSSRTAVTEYRGVRYREELNKYVTEIRPARSSKKIWLGTYDTAEEAARAFDIGNLCCKKNLPLNFPDSPRMLKRISSQLSPDEARSAIAKLAKEAARISINLTPDGETIRREEVDQAAALKAPELVQNKADEVLPEIELQTHHLEAAASSLTHIAEFYENVVTRDEDAIAMPMSGGSFSGQSSRGSYSFNLSQVMFLDDDLGGISYFGIETPDLGVVQDCSVGFYYYDM